MCLFQTSFQLFVLNTDTQWIPSCSIKVKLRLFDNDSCMKDLTVWHWVSPQHDFKLNKKFYSYFFHRQSRITSKRMIMHPLKYLSIIKGKFSTQNWRKSEVNQVHSLPSPWSLSCVLTNRWCRTLIPKYQCLSLVPTIWVQYGQQTPEFHTCHMTWILGVYRPVTQNPRSQCWLL